MSSGSSNISYLKKLSSGVIFQETFENDNFVTADGWTIVQGNPVNSTSQSIPGSNGIKSFQCSGIGSGLSVISKSFSITGTYFEGWFYDDGTTTPGTGPYLKVQDTAGHYYQIGVRNSVSTTDYVCNGVLNFAQDNFSVPSSPIARSIGWHKFSLFVTLESGLNYEFQVDGVPTSTISSSFITSPFSKIFVCSGTLSDTLGTFGYFDQVGLYVDNFLNVYNAGVSSKVLNLYDSSWNNIYTANPFTGFLPPEIGAQYALNNPNPVFPFPVFIQVSQAQPVTSLEYTSNLIQVFPGDVYQYENFYLAPDAQGKNSSPTKITDLQYVPTALVSRNVSTGGVQETNQTALKDKLTWTHSHLQGWGVRENIDDWFWWCVQGNPFSLMVDNVNGCAFGVISTFVGAGSSSSVKLFNNISTNPTDSFKVGFAFNIRNTFNTQKQKVMLISKDVNAQTLTFDQNIGFDVNAGDYVYSERFFPFLELYETGLTGLTSKQGFSPPAYSWTQNAQEFNG